MIQIPEDGWGFGPPDSKPGGDTPRPETDSLLTGWPAPTHDGYLVVPGAEFWRTQPPAEDDPVRRADTMRERAGAVFKRQRAVGAFSRELDDLFTTVTEDSDWSQGLEHFDRSLAELRRKHADGLEAQEDREAFERHAGQFGAMQRIGLKRALVERQQADALSQLDEQLAYYAGKAATAPNDVFRSIAVDSGLQAIAELREAGYLFPEAARRLETAFRGRLDGADLEAVTKADPDGALSVLDDTRLFPNAGEELREKLREQLMALIARDHSTAPPSGVEAEYRDSGPSEGSPTAGAAEPTGETSKDREAAPAEDTKTDSLDGVGVGDGEIPNADQQKGEAIELSDEHVDLLVEAILNGASLATMRGGGRAAGRAISALRDTLRQTLRSFFKAPKPNSESGNAAERPKLPTGGIKRVDDAENLATGRYAADKVLRDRGDVAEAMYRPDFGSITFNYGKPGNPAKQFEGGSGLSHIEAKHGAEVAREVVPRTLAYGRLDRMYGPPNGRRADIVHGDGRVTLSLFRDKQRETWVITGFEAHK